MKRRYFAAPTSVLSVLLLVLLAYPVGLFSAGTAAAAPGVTVTPEPVGSPTYNGTLLGTNFDLSQVGYESSEYFLSGTASSYVPVNPLTSDGKWTVTTGASSPYTTRIAVDRPIDPRKFNGTVVVEWLNVSGGLDDAPDWTLTHNELIREGFAWVGVSAQQVGVQAAATTDPSEYSSLSIPSDSFSYDIYSQAGQTVRDDSAQILGGLTPRKLIAAGESQSAGRMMTYIDAVQPIAHVYNGFLVHSQFGTGAALSQAPQTTVSAPTPTTIRSDLGVPVLEFETETDVFNSNLTDRDLLRQSTQLPPLGGGGQFALRSLRSGHRTGRHRQRSGCGREPGRHAESPRGCQSGAAQLRQADQHRWNALGTRLRDSFAQPVGELRDCTASTAVLGHDPVIARGVPGRCEREHHRRGTVTSGRRTRRHPGRQSATALLSARSSAPPCRSLPASSRPSTPTTRRSCSSGICQRSRTSSLVTWSRRTRSS